MSKPTQNSRQDHIVQPFAALRPIPDLAQEVVAPPYDVVNTAEALALAEEKPWSFLHISKPEIDLPEGTDVYSNEVYSKASENIKHMMDEGVLRQDPEDYYYIYQLQLGDHIQTGIVGAGSVAAYEANLIRRHEFTQPNKETDRVRQIDAVNAQTGPIFTTHKPDVLLAEVIQKTIKGAADYHVVGEGKVEHTLWVVTEPDDIAKITQGFDRVKVIYIADGHHRTAAASRIAEARKADNPNHTGAEQYNFFLIVSFPESEVQILDYNRVVKDLNGLSEAGFLKKIEAEFIVEQVDKPAKPTARNNFGMYLNGKWYALALKEPAPNGGSPVDRLDISLLTSRLLEPILNIGDPRIDPRIDFIGGIHGMIGLEKRVDSGDWAVAFALFPTSIIELISVADAKEIMPPKSTWFEPKLADGMISLMLE
ncbi:MAG: DUF1015 family protein [Rhodospirillales bacterium]|nr:DUF1015 family protein [Rhodospirillales bacterium]